MTRVTAWAAMVLIPMVLIPGVGNQVRAQGSDFFIFANEGQSAEQQRTDELECFRWATDQTGFDPSARPTATRPPPEQEAARGGVARGALTGLAVGTAVGAIRGSGGKQSRAIGAAAGGIAGGMRRNDQQRRQRQAQENWEREQIAAHEQNRARHNRAFAACMEGRGYTLR